jgi:hypothetical protein
MTAIVSLPDESRRCTGWLVTGWFVGEGLRVQRAKGRPRSPFGHELTTSASLWRLDGSWAGGDTARAGPIY